MKRILLIIFLTISLLLPAYYALAQPKWEAQKEWKVQKGRKAQERSRAQERPKDQEGWKAQEGWKSQEGWKAQNGWKGGRYPYGDYYPGPREGRYGARKAVRTEGEARDILRKYFSPRKATIGEIKERNWFFEAEIRDRNNSPVDRVIIDKRTGRIRSIY
jgi:Ni/Co efflux regulator RcnB